MTQNTPTKPPAITLEWIEEQEAFHKKKLSSLAVLKTALLDMVTPEPGVGHAIPAAPAVPSFKKTLLVFGKKKNAILRAVAGPQNGLTTQEIVSACINAGLDDTNQANTSPQLSLYKTQDLIKLVNGRWIITDKGREYLSPPKN